MGDCVLSSLCIFDGSVLGCGWIFYGRSVLFCAKVKEKRLFLVRTAPIGDFLGVAFIEGIFLADGVLVGSFYLVLLRGFLGSSSYFFSGFLGWFM